MARSWNYHYQILYEIYAQKYSVWWLYKQEIFPEYIPQPLYVLQQPDVSTREESSTEQVWTGPSLGYQMSLSKGSSSEPVWTGLQSSPPDVTSKGDMAGDSCIVGEGGLGLVQLVSLSPLNRRREQLWKHYLLAMFNIHMLTCKWCHW